MTARVRTAYSFREAVGKVEDVIKRLTEIELPFAPITDVSSTFGYQKWKRAAAKVGLKPVFGVELAVSSNIYDKKPIYDNWTFIAKSDLRSINELIGTATEQFRYRPLLTIEQAMNAIGSVYGIVGHRTNLTEIKPIEGLYVGLGPACSKGYIKTAVETGHSLINVSDNRYPDDSYVGLYEVISGYKGSVQNYAQGILSDAEWRNELFWCDNDMATKAIINRDFVLLNSNAVLGSADMAKPPHEKPLYEMCVDGAKEIGVDLTNKEYRDRLEKEIDIIAKKKFEDYFYIVSDICRWSRQRMIVGPARGSSCGSLVCYLLGITTIDPLKYGLIFERFIDINRKDLPDIDIDFSNEQRERVFEYLNETYGNDRVARLGTVAMYQPKSALGETAGALGIPRWAINDAANAFVKRAEGHERHDKIVEDTLALTTQGKALVEKHPEIAIAGRMENHPRHSGQHAAGIVITAEPVANTVAVDRKTGATMCDKRDAEDFNLLKIDALGLTQLSIFEYALELIGFERNYLFTLPLDDAASFDVANAGRFAGVFQFNGHALQNITSQVKVESINDIISLTALVRPGPMDTGGTGTWVKIKRGEREPSYQHQLFIPILEETLGVMTYQEQVMRIAREIGGLSWEDVTALRKAIAKSLGREAFKDYEERWKKGAIERGVPEQTADDVWGQMCAYGAYAFNKSHAVAYGIISYWCLWLKAHYPIEFAAATLSYSENIETQIKILRELAGEGVDYIPAHKDYSKERWSIAIINGQKKLVGPLTNIIGIGKSGQEQILSARARREKLPDSVAKVLSNQKTKIDSLYPIQSALNRIMPDPRERNITTSSTKISEVQLKGYEYNVMVFCLIETIRETSDNEESKVERRGYKVNGNAATVNLKLIDDTDAIFAKVSRKRFTYIGRELLKTAKPGKSLYAIKGKVYGSFRMIEIESARYIGEYNE